MRNVSNRNARTVSRRAVLAAGVAAGPALTSAYPARAGSPPVLFFSAHQDDETLTFGAGINNHVNHGYSVHVVLATDGINSSARHGLGLSRPEFARARDDEFRRACGALRVSSAHISRFAAEDGTLTVARARDIILDYLVRYPGARVKAPTDRGGPLGQHLDHTHLGQAAVRLRDEGRISDLRLYVEPYEVADFRARYGPVSTEHTATPQAVRAAVNEYKRGYGIGYRSTPGFFDMVEADPVSYYHA
jgi:LmbE family N-acetylglucosaminyl deacetylase